MIVAVPVSIGIALFLTELAPAPDHGLASSPLIDLLAAVPSVVFGLWGIYVLAPAMVPVYHWLHDVLGGVPILGSLFGERRQRCNFMTAGLILAIMIVPIITSITREVFDTVPDSDKQAAWALGATRWEMIKGAVLPAQLRRHRRRGHAGPRPGDGRDHRGRPGHRHARCRSPRTSSSAATSIPAVIVDQFGESSGDFTAALIGMGVVLFVVTVLVNLLAQVVVRRAEIRMRGAGMTTATSDAALGPRPRRTCADAALPLRRRLTDGFSKS